MQIRSFVAMVVCVVALAAELSAQDKPVFGLAFRGEISASGRFTTLTMSVSSGSPRAVLVYAEPSHALLGVFLDNAEGEPQEASWFAGLLPAGTSQVMQMALREGATATLQGPRPAAGDTHLVIRTLYADGAGAVIDRPFKMVTRLSKFAFAIELLSAPESEATTVEPSLNGPVGTFRVLCGIDGSCTSARTTHRPLLLDHRPSDELRLVRESSRRLQCKSLLLLLNFTEDVQFEDADALAFRRTNGSRILGTAAVVERLLYTQLVGGSRAGLPVRDRVQLERACHGR